MKKLLFVALAAVGMTACVQNQELALPKNTAAIAFDSFVGNPTKADPSYNEQDNLLTAFDVWAFMDDVAANVLTDEDVTKNGGAWGYYNTQYWFPNHTYYFAALAPMNSTNITSKTLATGEAAKLGLGEIAFTNVNGTEDLLYAKAKVSTPTDNATLANQGMPAVALQFQHLLSKVKFTFKNGFTTDKVTVKVSEVAMTAPKSATIDLAQADYNWENHAETVTLEFGATGDEAVAATDAKSAADERLTIPAPATQSYNVSFKVEVYQNGVLAVTENKTAVIENIALEMGKAYNFTAVIDPTALDLHAIEFTATVEAWDTTFEGPVGSYVNTAAELEAKVNGATKDIVVALGDDIEGEVMLVEKPGVHVTIDGNGHIYNGQMKIHANSTRNTGAITIKNVKFQTSTPETNFVYAVDFGNAQRYSQNITVMDCTFEDLTTRSSEPSVVGVKVNATQNLVVKNCTAKNLHSLLQAQSCDADVLVEGCTTVNCKNGISFGNTARPVLRNSTIVATEYGIRADGNASRGALVVKNTTITAKQPIVVRKVTTNGYKVTLGNEVVLNTDDYHVVFTAGSDDAAYVAPAEGAFTYLSVNPDFKVFPIVPMLTPIVIPETEGTENEAYYEGIGLDKEGAYVVTENVGVAALSQLIVADAEGFAGKTAKLDADIDLAVVARASTVTTKIGDSDAPIGSTGERDSRGRLICKPFKGTFDGNGKAIKNLYQSGWDMGYEWGQYGSIGLFSELEGATVKNLTIEGMEAQVEGGDISFIAGSATGECVFENITIKNSQIGTYNNGCGGIIGWSGEGSYTFKNITLESDVVLGGLWGSFDSSIGGVVGQAEPGATYNFENVTVNCRIDAYNDCTASYDYYNYRMCGMIIGRCEETTTIDGKNYPDLSKYNMTFNNVTVNYGTWMNYHYCRKSGERAVRVEAGYAYGGIAADRDHSTDNVHCYECIPFNQLIGGDQYAVKGLPAVDGVTVNYPAEYTCTLCGQQHNVAQ